MSAKPTPPRFDLVARMADAWDCKGAHVLRPPTEHAALAVLAALPAEVARVPWHQLTGAERKALVFAARRAVELGRACAWVFGDGQGARL